MQRFPIAKYIALNIGLWGIFLGLQAACHNYGGLCEVYFLSVGCLQKTNSYLPDSRSSRSPRRLRKLHHVRINDHNDDVLYSAGVNSKNFMGVYV